MMRRQLTGQLILALLAMIAVGACSSTNGPGGFTLDDLSDPDSNTAVVMLDQDVIEGNDTVKAGVQEVYLVDTGRAWEELSANSGLKQVRFTVADPYSTARYLIDGTTNTFRWIGPTGREYYPILDCPVTVRSAFVIDTRSTLWLETACTVAPVGGGGSVTILVKARRVGMPITQP